MSLAIRPAEPRDRPRVLELFTIAFKAPADPAEWEWKYDRNPRPAISVVACEGEDVVGFFGALGTRYRGAEGDLPGTSAVDVMTSPVSRSLGRRGLFKELGDTFRRLNAERGIPFDFGFPHERARQIEERLLGCTTIERAGQLVKPLPLEARRGPLRRLRARVRRGEPFGRGHEALAEILHAREGWRSDRSADVLLWRFLERPGVVYDVFQLADLRGRARAFAAVRLVGDRALLVDLQLADEEGPELVDLLAAISEGLTGTPARFLAFRGPREGTLSGRLRLELGFADEESDTHFFVRPFDPGFDLLRAARAFDYRYSDHDVF